MTNCPRPHQRARIPADPASGRAQPPAVPAGPIAHGPAHHHAAPARPAVAADPCRPPTDSRAGPAAPRAAVSTPRRSPETMLDPRRAANARRSFQPAHRSADPAALPLERVDGRSLARGPDAPRRARRSLARQPVALGGRRRAALCTPSVIRSVRDRRCAALAVARSSAQASAPHRRDPCAPRHHRR
jgi:hypothetical protein